MSPNAVGGGTSDSVLFELAVCGCDIVHRKGGIGDAVGHQREGIRQGLGWEPPSESV